MSKKFQNSVINVYFIVNSQSPLTTDMPIYFSS